MSPHDHVGELVKIAGHRQMPDPEQMARARAAARAEWTHVVEHRPWRFSTVTFTAAALVALTLAAVTWFRKDEAVRPHAPAVEVATLQKIVGTVLVTRAGSPEPRVIAESGLRVRAGDRLETAAASRVALALSGGTLAKLDGDSTVALDTSGSVTLSRGAVFVDAGPESRDPDLRVNTPLGVVRHLGTQFEVRLQDEAVRIRVREGTIAFENARGRWVSHAGEALVAARGLEPERRPIFTYGPEWSWLDPLMPSFILEGSTVGEFLQWVGREHGLRWEYTYPAMRDRVERIVLHGSIDGLTAEEALAAVLPTCGLTFRLSGDLLVISLP